MARRTNAGVPETVRHLDDWQITTWQSEDWKWMVRVDGPHDRFWETKGLRSRTEARSKGREIVEGFINHAR